MATRKRTKGLRMISKTLHRKLTIEEKQHHRKPWGNSGDPETYVTADPVKALISLLSYILYVVCWGDTTQIET